MEGFNFYQNQTAILNEDPENYLINHPAHYTSMSVEAIDLMQEAEGVEAVKDYCICNVWKYLCRHKHKGNDVQDMKKLVWYANKYIELCENHISIPQDTSETVQKLQQV